MKKFILITLIGLGSFGPAFSQRVRILPTLGLNMAYDFNSRELKDQYENNSLGSTIRFGGLILPYAGVLADYTVSDRLTVRSGLAYSGKGGSLSIRSTDRNNSSRGTIKSRYGYLEIPLLLNLEVGNSGLRFVGGPVLGLAVGARSKGIVKGGGDNFSYSEKLSIGTTDSDEVLPIEIGLSLGLTKTIELAGRPLEGWFSVQPSLSNYIVQSQSPGTYTSRHFLLGFRISYPIEVR